MKNIILTIGLLFCTLIINAQQPEGDWDRTLEMKSGYFRVIKNGKAGVINSNGEILIPCEFDQVYDLTDDNYVKVLKNRKTGLYHIEQGIIISAEYDQIWTFEGEMVKVLKDRKYGYINKDGLFVIPVEYNNIWSPDENGLIKVLKDGKTGFYDTNGNVILPADYQQIWSFEGDLAKVLKNGKLGYVNKDGEEVIPAIYDHIGSFENGRAKAFLNGTVIYFDEHGNVQKNNEQDEKNSTLQTTPQSAEIDNSKNVDNSMNRLDYNRDGNSREIIIRNSDYKKPKKQKSFEGHLQGLNIGVNGYLNSNYEDIIPDAKYSFMEVNYNKSCEISIYPVEHSTRLIGSYVGLVSAIGLQFNNYRFNLENPNQLITPETQSWFPEMPTNIDLSKAKLTLFTLNVPLLLEIQLPDGKGHKGMYLSGGVIGSMKLNAHTKVVYNYRNVEYKRRMNNDMGLQMFRYSFVVRAGYDWLGIYAQYSPMSLFKNNKGPELFPYSVGLSINF
jgi:hypothetical protein